MILSKQGSNRANSNVATYAIGDLQGCLDEFRQLLELIQFDPAEDQLWLTGDLVGRGPQSLETLRFVHFLADSATVVLGNHDLHLLAQAEGIVPASRQDSSLDAVINAPDSQALLAWLRHRPVLHIDHALGFGLVHAGLPPQWDIDTADSCANELQQVLRGPGYQRFLSDMYGNRPPKWHAGLEGTERLRFITNCFTRLRYCHSDGSLNLHEKGKPNDLTAQAQLTPWFAMPGRQATDIQWLFGHWSTLGQVAWPAYGVHCLDTGCLWGGTLTALCLDTGEISALPCKGHLRPASPN